MQAVRGGGPASRHWRVVNWESYRPLLQAQLLDPVNPLYQVVDYARVERILRRKTVDAGHVRYVYGALTAAIWLGEREDRHRIARLADMDSTSGSIDPTMQTT
jgi:hypothetical protein